jgi:hypothetical protein
MKMQIFRVECIHSGIGPYRSGGVLVNGSVVSGRLEAIEKFINDNGEDRPSAPLDMGIGRWPDSDEHFGFDSIDSLLSWFGPWLSDLERVGYRVLVYEAEHHDVDRGEKQVLFKKKYAELIGSLTP